MSAERLAPAMPVLLADKVRFLSRPEVYAEHPQAVELRETHMSYVFMTPTRVYKMKKPMAHAYADLLTLDSRGVNCRNEVRLNRRLAPDVYLGVTALTQGEDGTLALGGAGRVVEWLVQMQRLPAAAMLDHLIVHGLLSQGDVDQLAQRLGDFFAALPRVEVSVDRHRAQLRQQIETSTQLLARSEFALPGSVLATVHGALSRYLDDGADLAERVEQRRIVEGHGDLRPEHVCLVHPPVIIDCLEFNRDLRLLDPFDEIAFLGLECARLGAAWVGPSLRQSLEAHLQDHPPARLSAFYTAMRACVRARLAAAHLLEPVPRTPERWLPLAHDYLSRAQRACAALD
jgi:aminoglycoside phosphotransferase family enzyme